MLARTLLDLSQTATISDSLKLGKAVLNEIGGINRLHKENVEQAGFAVLKLARHPFHSHRNRVPIRIPKRSAA